MRRSSRRRCCFGVVKFQCCCHKLKAVKFLCHCYKNVFRIRLLIWTLVPIGVRRILERSGQNSNDCENARKTNIGPTRIKRYRVAHVDVRIAPVNVRIWWCSQRGWGTKASSCEIKPEKRQSGKAGKSKTSMKSSASGTSTTYKKGVERKPPLRRSTFSEACLAQLARHLFSPVQQKFIPDGRWTVETRSNGQTLHFTAFLVSFD